MSGAWWSTVWSSAMTEVFDDVSQLESGARLARRGSLGTVEMEPGSVVVRGDGFVAQLGLRPLEDEAWDRVAQILATDTNLAAAVLTGELPVELFGQALTSGVNLSPRRGRVLPDCSCPDWHEPCKHVVALSVGVGELVEADPWTILLLLGRSRHELVEQVRAVRSELRGLAPSEITDEPRGTDPGIVASAAFRKAIRPLPSARPIPRRAGKPIVLAPRPPADSGVELADLRELVSDAASRAVDLLNGIGDGALSIAEEHDLARIAHRRVVGNQPLGDLAASAGRDVDDLERDAMAWSVGGGAAVDAMSDRFEPSDDALVAARSMLGPDARVRGNTITSGDVQLRVDRHGSWWRLGADPRLGWVMREHLGSDLGAPIDGDEFGFGQTARPID